MANGAQITRYLKECAAAEGIDKKIKFHHHVKRAQWSTAAKTWTLDVTLRNPAGGAVDGEDVGSVESITATSRTLRTRFVLFGTGYYDYQEGLRADISGIQNFQGTVVHPQFWPADLDYVDKKVVIVGSGATAVTLLPAIADQAAHVTMLQRSPSYIMSVPSEDAVEKTIRFLCPSGLAARLIRFKWILVPFLLVSFCHRFPGAARRAMRSATRKQLPPGTLLDPDFNPRYYPWEQRMCMCPDGDFYASLRSGKGSVKTGVIEEVTSTSIRLQSGEELPADMIVTATGLKLCVGGGVELVVDGASFHIPDHFMWNGAMLEGLPNFVFAFGYVDASWTLGADATAQLTCRLLREMARRDVSMIVPRQSVRDKTRGLKEVPFLNLSSTYVREGKADVPKVGDQAPWRRRSYYWKDILVAWWGDVDTGLEWSK